MKHKPTKAHELRKEKGKKTCQRCGDGVYLASHKKGKVRLYCGKCHMTIFEQGSQKA